MLKERTAQDSPKRKGRRWYSDEDLDLIVWLDEDGGFTGFQLCYDKKSAEHAVTWTESDGFKLHQVDTGEPGPEENSAPILRPLQHGHFPVQRVTSQFLQKCGELEHKVSDFVLQKLQTFPKTK